MERVSQVELRLYRTAEHPCGYWPERSARNLLLAPGDEALPLAYPQSLALGFRRSGTTVYRPWCPSCKACIAVRLPVERFRPDRNQRRCLARNADVELNLAPPQRNSENFALYRRYLASRHPGGGMDEPEPEDFDAFLAGSWAPTHFFELRESGRLLALAVTDVVPDALSAVYTFFDPDDSERSPGTLAILRQIAWARDTGRSHLYLGYWIAGHPKMDYKRRFGPLEALVEGRWQALPEA
jgi:leucyl-tRNA---protein transferase